MTVGTHALVAHHVAEAVKEAEARSISRDVVARCLLSEAIRLFREEQRPIEDIAAELAAAADNLDEDAPLVFIRP